VRVLLDRGADINAHDWNGNTALAEAALRRHDRVVELLLSRGAERTLPDAVALGDVELVERLIETPAVAPEFYWRFGDLIVNAMSRGNSAIVQLLVDHAVSCDTNRVNGVPFVVTAAKAGWVEVVRALIKHGADATAVDRDDKTALDWATEFGHTAVIELLNAASETGE
jgi:ankyrin repeat protein